MAGLLSPNLGFLCLASHSGACLARWVPAQLTPAQDQGRLDQ